MSLWWARKEQLDPDQLNLIEELELNGNYLVLGPPGSGKTNVLLRRAQFVRTQGMPNIMVLTFTRALTEFLKTGCINSNGSELFPTSLINTVESWIREIFKLANKEMPTDADFRKRKAAVACEALRLADTLTQPKYDTIFVDEAQDLLEDEIKLLEARSHRLFFVGDDRQKIFEHSDGLPAIRRLARQIDERILNFHYRLAPEICSAADRILSSTGGKALASTCHYDGPRPGRIDVHSNNRAVLVGQLVQTLITQLRAYSDRISQGDKIGIVVPRSEDREIIASALDKEIDLTEKWQIVRARTGERDDRHFNPALDASRPILIMTEQACKGLEFRALHWMFVDDIAHHRTDERYYTIITRAKTSLDLYNGGTLPNQLARAHAVPSKGIWS